MDFLVVGLAFGALLILAGYAVREFGAFFFAPARVRKQFGVDEGLTAFWRALGRFTSSLLMFCGVAIWIVAAVAVAFGVSDKTGAYLIAGAATIVSLAGAAAIYLHTIRSRPYSRSLSKEVGRTIPTGPAAGANVEEPDAWQPRVVPEMTAAFSDEMPAWGPSPEQVEQPVVALLVEAEAPAPEPEATAPTIQAQAPPEPELAAAEVLDESLEQTVVEDEGPRSDQPEPVIEAPEPVVVEESLAVTEPFDLAAPVESDAADALIFEEPAAEASPVADEPMTAQRWFKSSILSDIDEPVAAEADSVFKSAILTDLSSIRLPDDGPRFRSTALVDPEQPSHSDSPDQGAPHGAAVKHR